MVRTDPDRAPRGRGHDGLTALVRAPPHLTPKSDLPLVRDREPDHIADRESPGPILCQWSTWPQGSPVIGSTRQNHSA